MTEPKTSRPTLDEYFMDIAKVVANRSTCIHRDQGAILVREGRILSTGYNGSPPGQIHCIDVGNCAKKNGLDCRAEGLHGESNAIVAAARAGVSVVGATMYSVYSPCLSCCNMIAAAGIVMVKYEEVYDGFTDVYGYLEKLGIMVGRVMR